jgi:hypothetical protein
LHHNSFRLGDESDPVRYQHAAGHRIDDLLQGRAHAVVFRQASGESGVALRQFDAQVRDLLLQVAVGGFQQRRRGDELREGVGQQPRAVQGAGGRRRLLEQHENRATFAYSSCTMSAKLERHIDRVPKWDGFD